MAGTIVRLTHGLVALGTVGLLLAAATTGCDKKSEWPAPAERLPGWVYDAPFYYEPQPENDLAAKDAGLDGQIPHYYTRELNVPIKRPDASLAFVNKTPHLAVYYSNDHGLNWHRAGYFGLDANFFVFVAPEPGTYSIRFVGPGFAPTRLCDAVPPHRVYHVDNVPPAAIVQINPTRPVYQVGDAITLTWNVSDLNIASDAKVTVYEISHPGRVRELSGDFPLSGSVGVVVPPSAEQGGVRFAVEATDKCGNIGRGFSFLVQAPSIPTSQPESDRVLMHEPAGSPRVSPPPVRGPEPVVTPDRPSADRLPIVPTPTLPLNPAQPAVRPTAPPDPADRAIEPTYRPRLYPTSAHE